MTTYPGTHRSEPDASVGQDAVPKSMPNAIPAVAPSGLPDQPPNMLPSADGKFSDESWGAVLSAVDRTYAELVEYQERLEHQNEELHEARRFIESVLGSVSDVMAVINREGRIEEISASLISAIQSAPGYLAGQSLPDLFDKAGQNTVREALDRLRLSRQSESFEANLITADGAQPFDIVLAARISDRGRYVGAVLTGRPLGELRRAYAELEHSHRQLQETQSQLVRNEKLASLGRLLAGVAHELNNPISFVYASVHALEKYVSQFETYFERAQSGAPREELVALRQSLKLERNLRNLSEAIHGARDGAERVRDIVADLRRLSAEGSGEKVGFDLVETARIAARWVERGSKSGISVHFTGLDNIRASGVPGHVQQIVMNLVQNGMDALRDHPAPSLSIDVQRRSGMARLCVCDNGPGVPEDQRASIFDPFFTTKPVGQGTGLGLSISAKIAQEHGGGLNLIPADGGCFQLDLPLWDDAAQSLTPDLSDTPDTPVPSDVPDRPTTLDSPATPGTRAMPDFPATSGTRVMPDRRAPSLDTSSPDQTDTKPTSGPTSGEAQT